MHSPIAGRQGDQIRARRPASPGSATGVENQTGMRAPRVCSQVYPNRSATFPRISIVMVRHFSWTVFPAAQSKTKPTAIRTLPRLYSQRQQGLVPLLPMVVSDFIPEFLTVATAASGVVGVYYERLRKKLERQEPAQMEQVANEAVADVKLEPTVLIPPVHDQEDKLTVSRTELQELLDSAVGTAVTAMKDELAIERRQDRQAGLRASIAFFIMGILATVAITLYVHPLK